MSSFIRNNKQFVDSQQDILCNTCSDHNAMKFLFQVRGNMFLNQVNSIHLMSTFTYHRYNVTEPLSVYICKMSIARRQHYTKPMLKFLCLLSHLGWS